MSANSGDDLVRILVIGLALLVLVPVVMMAFAMPMMGMMWWDGGMMGGSSPVWGLGMLLVWLLILAGVGYLLYRGLVVGAVTPVSRDPALEELRVAYARGDVSEEEFEKRREKLERER